jgi:predicted regulator of Ras-like GTPase activity (Roadblock/LC7/MglB family)
LGAGEPQLGQQAHDFGWLISGFAMRVPGVTHAIVVSTDGLLIAVSEHLPRDSADQLAAATSGLVSLVNGAARIFDGDEVKQTVVELGKGFFLVMTIRDGSILAVLAEKDSDVGVIGYEMAKLTKQAGDVLTPELRTALQEKLPPVEAPES